MGFSVIVKLNTFLPPSHTESFSIVFCCTTQNLRGTKLESHCYNCEKSGRGRHPTNGNREAWSEGGCALGGEKATDNSGDESAERRRHVLTSSARRYPSGVLPPGFRTLSENTQVREMSQPRRCVRVEGSQEILPLERLCLRQVYSDRGETEGDGGPSGVEATAGSGRIRSQRVRPYVPGTTTPGTASTDTNVSASAGLWSVVDQPTADVFYQSQ